MMIVRPRPHPGLAGWVLAAIRSLQKRSLRGSSRMERGNRAAAPADGLIRPK